MAMAAGFDQSCGLTSLDMVRCFLGLKLFSFVGLYRRRGGRGQEQTCKAIERTPQQSVRDEGKQGRCKQELQRVDEPLGDELINAVEHDRDEEGGSGSSPTLMQQLEAPLRVGEHGPQIALPSQPRVLNASPQSQ